jgi:hypothetical protein
MKNDISKVNVGKNFGLISGISPKFSANTDSYILAMHHYYTYMEMAASKCIRTDQIIDVKRSVCGRPEDYRLLHTHHSLCLHFILYPVFLLRLFVK